MESPADGSHGIDITLAYSASLLFIRMLREDKSKNKLTFVFILKVQDIS